jgi:hypothetical protein
MNVNQTLQHGFIFEEDTQWNHMFIVGAVDKSPASTLIKHHPWIRASWLLSLHGQNIHTKDQLKEII